MRFSIRRGGFLLRFSSLFVLAFVAGCSPRSPLDANGINLAPGSEWKTAPFTSWPVPGTPIAAWSGPSGASLVAYLALPAPGLDAKSLGAGLVTRLENLPGLRVVKHEVEKVDGLDAAFVVAVAPGNGNRFAPTGTGEPIAVGGESLKPTRRVNLLIPRDRDTVGILWHAPEEKAKWLDEVVAATLKSVKISRDTLATYSY